MDPEFAALLAQLPPPPPETDDVLVIRDRFNVVLSVYANFNARSLPSETEYRVEDHKVPVDGGEITVRCVIPTPAGAQADTSFPVLFWMHGGGWTVGNIDTDDFYLRILCVDLQISIVNVEYRLAPEHPFPAGLNDCYAALKWVANNAAALHASLSRGFIVAGLSAGANLAAVLAHRALEDPFFKEKRVTGQVMQAPMTVHLHGYPEKYKAELLAMEENKDAPILNRREIEKIARRLQAPPEDPEISPLLYPSHKGLAAAYLQVMTFDPLRDDGLLYEKVLRESGVKTKIDVIPYVVPDIACFSEA
ncbi:AB hydrolase superfamily protein B1A11.02 [Grifola frondosa]|uniref:AB hydrolase superfamily protein B1A11.02 n=1 Tax=Grifola frondosa TaxID=5627 RepID=A0A1C7MDS8_GRIFR|nr:AB hydrolase superfamily protein B1A11.02 [Grifola frondosa]